MQSRIHANQAHQFHTPFHHTPCLLSCPLSIRLLWLFTFRLHSVLTRQTSKIQNTAATIGCKANKSDHVHHILQTLHWLPVTHRIQYKISTICFSYISGTAPQYLSDLLQPYTPAKQLWSAPDTQTFVTTNLCKHKNISKRSFSYAVPSVWKNLPQTLRHSDSASSFKAALKTHLCNNYF